ncbi:hypothetical protein JW835_02170 [bacterium]|nr:hypothetical protein [bacterium]
MTKNKWMFFIGIYIIFGIAAHLCAIPAFARRYKISCSTCHSPFPRLKEYGEDFAGAGMILKEEEKERDYISAGDDLLWLNRDFPVAVRFEAYGLYEQDSDVKTDLQSPWGLKLLSGGTLYKNIGYYFYFFMSERGEVAGIEDAYIHFDNIFGSNLDIMIGQFQTSDPLMKRELRLTFEDYVIYKKTPGASKTNLTYDRGVMLVYGIDQTGTELVGQIVNGNGKVEAGSDQIFDQDTGKNLGFRINQELFGLFSLGGYVYSGTETDTSGLDNDILYWGPDLSISIGPVDITAQYLEREDSDAYFDHGRTMKTTGKIFEMIYSPELDKSRYYITMLYNSVDSDLASLNYETMTLSTTYLMARNLRFTLEYTRDLKFDKNRFVLGLISGF